MSTLSHLLLWYSLRMILISAIFYGYYRAFLRNRRFHRFNRFFLLSIPLLSLILPAGRLFMACRAGCNPIRCLARRHQRRLERDKCLRRPFRPLAHYTCLADTGSMGLYISGQRAAVALLPSATLYPIADQKIPQGKMGNIHFFGTHEPGAPFSFLNNIFWDDQLDRNSPLGKQIFRHETNHVRQKHSLDLLMLRPLMALYWINPFFH